MIEGVVKDGINWIVTTYQAEGLGGLLVYIIGGGILFGGMGFIFWAAAAANARGMKKDDKKDT